jgi:antitoxin VapB
LSRLPAAAKQLSTGKSLAAPGGAKGSRPRVAGGLDRPFEAVFGPIALVGIGGIYFSLEVLTMLHRAKPGRAKLFKSGGSQAVRLPKAFRFDGLDEVRIYRQGERVILEPLRPSWSPEFLALAGAAPDFPYPEEPPPAEPGPDFDS